MTTDRRMRIERGRVMHLVEPAGDGWLRSRCRRKHPVKGVNSSVPRAYGPISDWTEERHDYPDCKHCPANGLSDSTSPRS